MKVLALVGLIAYGILCAAVAYGYALLERDTVGDRSHRHVRSGWSPDPLSSAEIERRTRPNLARLTQDEWRDFDNLRGAWRDSIPVEGV